MSTLLGLIRKYVKENSGCNFTKTDQFHLFGKYFIELPPYYLIFLEKNLQGFHNKLSTFYLKRTEFTFS